MKKPTSLALLIVLTTFSFFLHKNASASTAWWIFCDHCSTNNEYTLTAFNAPQHYQFILISNRNVNETRKYSIEKEFTEGLGGATLITNVQRIALTADEEEVFEEAIDNANLTFLEIPRGDLDGLIPGLGDAPSVIGDIGSGRLPDAFSKSVNRFLEDNGYLPSLTSVNQQLAVLGVEAGAGFTIRNKSLIIVVIYDDGSTVSFRRRPDGEFVEWEATDESNQLIDFDIDPNGDIVIDPPDSGGGSNPDNLTFWFGNNNDVSDNDLAALINWFIINTVWECVGEIHPDGRASVSCSRRIIRP